MTKKPYNLDEEARLLMAILHHGSHWPRDFRPTKAALKKAHEAGMEKARVPLWTEVFRKEGRKD